MLAFAAFFSPRKTAGMWNYRTIYLKRNVLGKDMRLKPKQPKLFGVKFSLREIQRTFSIEIRNFKLWKMPN